MVEKLRTFEERRLERKKYELAINMKETEYVFKNGVFVVVFLVSGIRLVP